MRIGIVGAGGMGCAFAGYLARAGHAVTLLVRDPAQAEALHGQGLAVEPSGAEPFHVRPGATAEPAGLGTGSLDVVIVLTKSADTAAAVSRLGPLLAADGIAVTVQNGLGNEAPLAAAFGAVRTHYGVTTVGGRRLAPGRVAVTDLTAAGRSLTEFGPVERGTGSGSAVQLAAALSEAGLPSIVHEDVAPAVWAKLVVAVMGPLGSLLRRPVGTIWGHPEGQALLRRLFEEVAAVAAAEGVALDAEAAWGHAARTWEGTGRYLTSMAVDVLRGRRTEVDAIAAEVVRRAARHAIPVPLHEFLVRGVHLVEDTYEAAW